MEKVCRRYYLTLKDNQAKETTYVLNYFGHEDFGKKNYVLSTIDRLTLSFDNDSDFLNFLKDYLGIKPDNVKPRIEYQANKEKRYLDIAYSDKEILKPFAENSQTLIQDELLFYDFFTHFIKSVNKYDFYKFMSNKNHLNNRLQLLIDEYIFENKRYRRKDIKEHIRNYRVIRDYLLGMLEYNEIADYKINHASISYEDDSREDKSVKTPHLNLNTSDEFLNSLSTREEILKHYTLDELEKHELDIFDGLEPQRLILKK